MLSDFQQEQLISLCNSLFEAGAFKIEVSIFERDQYGKVREVNLIVRREGDEGETHTDHSEIGS